ncbi:MAG: histidine kinase [Chitinophagales bacterium]|nr:histidine kinase [Chitinophagales bacterium]
MKNRLGLHLLFWGTYLFLKTYVDVFLINYSYFNLAWEIRLAKALLPEAILLLPKILFAYFLMYYLIPRMGKESRWRLTATVTGVMALSLLLYHGLMQVIIMPMIHHEVPEQSAVSEGISRFIWRMLDILTVAGAACTLSLMRKQLKDAKREQQLIREKLQSELNFLRAQTNPHFLFNTLNSIYALARKQAPETAQVVMQLSKLLRYMLHECKETFVPLDREWKVIEDYIELEKIRYGVRVEVTCQTFVSNLQAPVAPLLLLPVVENAFKHGAGNNRGKTNISIHLEEQKGRLTFEVKNNIEAESEYKAAAADSGIGLSNVKRQLELLYPVHTFESSGNNGIFTTLLTFQWDDQTALPDR